MGTSFEKGTQGEVAKKVSNIHKSEMNSGKSAATPEERFKSLRKLANDNNAEAQYHLSQCYLNGEGTEEDQIAYLFWLKESAESGYAEAQFELSQLYYKGVGVNESEEKGMYWLRKAAEGNSPRAQYVIGGMNINDDGEVQDADAFFYWMDKAAKNGFADAQYCLSLCYELGIGVEEDEQQHTYWLHKAAESGSVNAQNELNELGEESEKTEDDDDIDLDEFLNHAQEELGQMIGDLQASQLKLAKVAATPEERFEILHELAKDDCIEAQYELSQCYLNGDGTEEDETACLYWLKKAAEGDWVQAQLELGKYYLNEDEPNEADIENGTQWILKAANGGLAEAQSIIAILIGLDDESHYEEALHWAELAAEQNDLDGKIFLTRKLYIHEQYDAAFNLYKDLAERGSEDAQCMIGVCYYLGRGVQKNITQAVAWFQRAAEKDQDDAIYILGWCYLAGLGVQENSGTSIQYFMKAADLGNIQAKKFAPSGLGGMLLSAGLSLFSSLTGIDVEDDPEDIDTYCSNLIL